MPPNIILLDEEEEDDEIQFLGPELPSTPRTPKKTTTTTPSKPESQPSLKRKLNFDNSTHPAQRGSPQSRQVWSPQALSRSQWNFQSRRSTAASVDAAEVLSPCSMPLSTSTPDTPERMSRSPPHIGKLSIGNNEHIVVLDDESSEVDEGCEFVEAVPATMKPPAVAPSRTCPPPRPRQFIDLEEEEDEEDVQGLSSVDLEALFPFTIIDSDEEDELEITGSTTRPEQGTRKSVSSRRRSTIYPLRNPPILAPLESGTEIDINNFTLTPHMTVELRDGDFLLITHLVRNRADGAVTLRGHRFQRSRDLNGLLPKTRNELCWAVEVDRDDARDALAQSLAEVPLGCVLKPREALVTNLRFPACTYRDEPHPKDLKVVERDSRLAVRWQYVTTWPSARARLSNDNAYCERVLRHLAEGDRLVRPPLLVADEKVRLEYRGRTVLGGSYRPGDPQACRGIARNESAAADAAAQNRRSVLAPYTRSPNWQQGPHGSSISSPEGCKPRRENGRANDMVDLTEEAPKIRADSRASAARRDRVSIPNSIDLTRSALAMPAASGTIRASTSGPSTRPKTKRLPGQKYTYGDAFCGAGGATRGAKMAGLQVTWGFDFNAHACATWRANFPCATLYELSAYDVYQRSLDGAAELRCDILHLSPPCQFFSPAHTVAGKDDEMNSASLLACGQLLHASRPRVVTLEQTFGIGHAEFTRWFNTLINMFTTNGYSLRWKICHLQDWGLPQRRQRLIIFASCPGEVLPAFPAYTHSRHPSAAGLAPYTSVASVLAAIPLGAPDHDLAAALAKPLHEQPWDAGGIAPRVITTHGGQNYHPGGRRGLTNREFAALQGFPLEHAFSDRNVKKQIGNAVPPIVARVLFGAVRRALEEVDGVGGEVWVID